MASGNTLLYFSPQSFSGPAATVAQFDVVVGTSAPVENFPVLAFDTSTVEYADFRARMPAHYAGTTGVTLHFVTGATTTTGGIVWEAAFRAIGDDVEDLDTTAQTYDYNTLVISTLPSVVGEVTYDTLAFTSGADMDSLVAGQEFVLRIRRATGNASDTAAGDAFLHALELRET